MDNEELYDVFVKRSGTTDAGRDYEDLYILDLILKFITDDTIQDFSLSSNERNFGSFDDVVLEIKLANGQEQSFAFQLKHTMNNGRVLPYMGLTARNGKYSISKYFSDFKKLGQCVNESSDDISRKFKFILCTNRKFQIPNKSLKIEDENLNIKILPWKADPKINSEGGLCFKFEVDESTECIHSSTNVEEYKRFFNQFFLYTNQANVWKLVKDGYYASENMFGCDIFERCYQFIKNWSFLEGKKIKLNKLLMKEVIAMHVLSPYIESFCSSVEFGNSKLLRAAIFHFDVTCFDREMVEKVKRIWGNIRDELEKNINIKKLNIMRTIYQISSDYTHDTTALSEGEITKLLWVINECPLIVNANEITLKAIQLCKHKKFILLTNDADVNLKDLLIFKNLSDLNPQFDVYQKILSEFKFSLQGKGAISLQTLIEHNEEIRKIVTTNELVQIMLDKPFQVGENKEILPEPHISRFVTSNIIDYNFLSKVDKETVIIISRVDNLEDLRHHLINFNVIKIEEYLNNENFDITLEYSSNSEKDIYISEKKCSKEDFEKICSRNGFKKRFYHFAITDSGKLEWVCGKGIINELEEYRSEKRSIEESQLYNEEPYNNINVICADPGMGKSVLMKNLKNNQSKGKWTIIIYSKDISSYFRQKNYTEININGFLDYIINEACKKYTNFDTKFAKILFKNCDIVFIWDGLDEISDENLKIILEFINKLNKKGFLQWITSRCHLKKILETNFNVFSRTIKQFNDSQQINYITQRLKNNCRGSELQDIITKIKNSISMVQHDDVLGIPLQIFMFTELFRQNMEKYRKLLNNVFSITDLYHHFVDEKFNYYYTEKANFKEWNRAAEKTLEEHKDSRIKKYEKTALKTFFDTEIIEDLKINCENFLKKIKTENDCFGIITEVTENDVANFLHPSYGEYFVATYFSRNYRFIPKFKELIFRKRFSNVRFLFDLLLAKNHPAHIATLYKNLQVLKHYSSSINIKDICGRNPLQVASSWGERYPILSHEVDNDKCIINDEDGSSVKEENPEYRLILEYLSEKCDPKQTDDLFKMNSLQYADQSLCLLPLVVLSRKQRINFADLKNFKDIFTILYYAVKFGYADMIDLMEDIPFIITKKQSSLLHLSAENSTKNCLQKLLSIEKYQNAINDGDKYGFTPLHIASQKGSFNIVEMLINSGANVNKLNKDGVSSIYVASQNGNVNVVSLLIAKGGNLNDANRNGLTPLHVASQNGHHEVVKLLLSSGADVDVADNNNTTPLYMATLNGHKEIVNLLINFKANVNSANKFGMAPLQIASQNGNLDIVRMLLNKNADANVFDKDGATPIFMASQNGHINIVRLLIGSRANVNTANGDKATPLYTATQNGYANIVQLLIGSGADVNFVNKFGMTPLYVACQKKYTSIVQLLVDFKADINIGDVDGWTPLFVTCANGYCDGLQMLIDSGANVNLVNKNGATPLQVAAQNGHVDVVKKLIEYGADVNNSNEDGITALYVAAENGYSKIVQLLINSKADVNAAHVNGATPLHIAAQNNHLHVINILIEAGASATCKNKDGVTPIYMAAQKGYTTLVRYLINSSVDVNCINNDQVTPLHIASKEGHFEIVQLLIKSGVDVNCFDKDGNTPIYVASEAGHFKIVELLIAANAYINSSNKDDNTCIHMVSCKGYMEIAQLLIKCKAHLNNMNGSGWVPLTLACANGHSNIANLLINKGVNVNTSNKDGTTPICVASQYGHIDVVRLLIQHGANINSGNKDGITPIHAAAQNNYLSIVEVLMDAGANVKSFNKFGLTAIDLASQKGYSAIVQLLRSF